MRGKSRRPKLFESRKSIQMSMQLIGNSLEASLINAGVESLNNQELEDVDVKVAPKYLQVTQKRLNKMGVIDLKPYFSRSRHRKPTKDGGWYLTVPIPVKTRSMSRRMYNQLRAIDIAPDEERTVVTDYLYDRRRESDATLLNYKPKSNTITKKRVGKNRHTYVSYRVVTDKSPASSWIINRGRVNEQDTSKTMIDNVNRLMKWKMKNM